MNSLKMNADYEVQLFSGVNGPQIVNQSLEFLLFFLAENAVFTTKNYKTDYLDYVYSITGYYPRLVSSGEFENYWGALKNIELERWWNSKLNSTQLVIDRGWCHDTFVMKSRDDFSLINNQKRYLLKDPHGMSGQKFAIIGPHLSLVERESVLEKFLSRGIFIVEPFLNRIYDFSHYVYPDGKKIFYQNFIDQKFQYRGTYFHDLKKTKPEDLFFYMEISGLEWSRENIRWNEIHQFYSQYQNELGYSVDSFVYLEDEQYRIRTMSEVNYRRTMGRVSFELAEKYAMNDDWSSILIVKNGNQSLPIWKRIKNLQLNQLGDFKVLALSPGDTRFDLILISGKSTMKFATVIFELKRLLPDCEFTINI